MLKWPGDKEGTAHAERVVAHLKLSEQRAQERRGLALRRVAPPHNLSRPKTPAISCSPPNRKEQPAMSLEQALAEHTTALKENTAALLASINAKAGATVAAAAKAATPPAAPAAAAAAPAAPPAATASLDYEKDVKPLALRVAKDKGREKLIEILGTFGVAQANLLKSEQWAEFTTKCNAALA